MGGEDDATACVYMTMRAYEHDYLHVLVTDYDL